MKKFLFLCTTMVLVLALAAPVSADLLKCDNFWVEMSADDMVIAGGGSGWNAYGNPSGTEGDWIRYMDPEPDWWNQWFYDHPPDPDRWKEITYDITMVPTGGVPAFVEVALNWSTLDFLLGQPTGPYGPPPTSYLEQYIVREMIFSDVIAVDTRLIGGFVIPDYNPEWVSIDVRYYNPQGGEPVYISGTICHECVPEPSTIVGLIGLALTAGIIVIRRK